MPVLLALAFEAAEAFPAGCSTAGLAADCPLAGGELPLRLGLGLVLGVADGEPEGVPLGVTLGLGPWKDGRCGGCRRDLLLHVGEVDPPGVAEPETPEPLPSVVRLLCGPGPVEPEPPSGSGPKMLEPNGYP
jgi:hypothetical protein